MNWELLLQALREHVTAGKITTYGNCSEWAYGHRNGAQAIGAMLEAAATRGHAEWTNRVVSDDGSLGNADANYGQGDQLRKEGVVFDYIRVNMIQCPPIVLRK